MSAEDVDREASEAVAGRETKEVDSGRASGVTRSTAPRASGSGGSRRASTLSRSRSPSHLRCPYA